MKRLLGLLTLALCASLHAQISVNNLVFVATAPSGSCGAGVADQQVISTGVIYTCQGGVWGVASGSGSAGGYPLAGTSLGLYLMDDGTGSTTLADSSANGRTITLPNSGGPTRVQGALQFVGDEPGVNTVIHQNATGSVVLLAYLAPTGSAYNAATSWLSPFWLGSTTNSGVGMGLYSQAYVSAFEYTSGSYTSQGAGSPDPVGGWHVIAFTGLLGANPLIYIDGNQVTTYTYHGTMTIPSTALWEIGAFGSTGTPGASAGQAVIKIGAVDFQPGVLTAQQVQQASAWLLGTELPLVKQLPVTFPPLNTNASNILACTGDSRVAGEPGTSGGLCPLISPANQGGVGWLMGANIGLGGGQGAQIGQLNSYFPSLNGNNVNNHRAMVYWSGVNGFPPQADCYETLTLAKNGFDVFRVTEPSGTNESGRDAFNQILFGQWQSCGIKALVSIDEIPSVGTDGASTTGSWATYFANSGGPHMTTAGYTVVANAAANVMNWFYALTPTTYTTSTAITSRNNIVSTSGSVLTSTLPDCQGLNQMSFLFKSLPASGSSAVTITPVNAETIDGASTYSLAANASVKLISLPLAPATGGCQWISTQ